MSKYYSKFKEKYLDSLDVDNVTGEQMIERTNCLECDEYNHEKYYCPIFCDVIRQTVKDLQLIRCKDCKWAVKCYSDVVMVDQYGEEIHEPLGMNGYCSMAERKSE